LKQGENLIVDIVVTKLYSHGHSQWIRPN